MNDVHAISPDLENDIALVVIAMAWINDFNVKLGFIEQMDIKRKVLEPVDLKEMIDALFEDQEARVSCAHLDMDHLIVEPVDPSKVSYIIRILKVGPWIFVKREHASSDEYGILTNNGKDFVKRSDTREPMAKKYTHE